MSLKNTTKRTKKVKTTEELFPHPTFPYRIEHAERGDIKICWFSHSSHVQKYIDRSKLKAGTYTLNVHPDYATVDIKTEKKTRQKKELFADLDTYVKVTDKPKRSRKASAPPAEAPSAPSRSARKAPAKASKGTAAPEAPKRRSRSKK